jgi:hypothetical protein
MGFPLGGLLVILNPFYILYQGSGDNPDYFKTFLQALAGFCPSLCEH